MRRLALGIALVLAELLPALAVEAPLRERARALLVERIGAKLALSKEKSLAVGRVLEAAEGRREKLEREREGVAKEIEAALTGKPDDTEVAKLVERASKIESELALVPTEGFREMQKVLSPVEQAKLLLERRNIQQELRTGTRRPTATR
jgi:hypothetical protein